MDARPNNNNNVGGENFNDSYCVVFDSRRPTQEEIYGPDSEEPREDGGESLAEIEGYVEVPKRFLKKVVKSVVKMFYGFPKYAAESRGLPLIRPFRFAGIPFVHRENRSLIINAMGPELLADRQNRQNRQGRAVAATVAAAAAAHASRPPGVVGRHHLASLAGRGGKRQPRQSVAADKVAMSVIGLCLIAFVLLLFFVTNLIPLKMYLE